jgi:hypothetical protein
VKLMTVAALSAVLIVPCFANAKVSANSPANPFPRQLGKNVAYSPAIPFPRQLGKKGTIAVIADSPANPFPRQLGKQS